jgi:hypothetical protein
MKVTAIIPDNLISEVKHYSNGKNITDSLIIALNEWVNLKRITELNDLIKKKPLEFKDGFNSGEIRNINRKI